MGCAIIRPTLWNFRNPRAGFDAKHSLNADAIAERGGKGLRERVESVWRIVLPGRWKRLRFLAWVALGIATAILLRAQVAVATLPEGIKASLDLVYREVDGKRLRLDLYEPDSAAPPAGRPAIVAIHGGGWRGGGKSDFGPLLFPLVRAGHAVIAIDYRLSRPGKPSWPGNLEDVREALAWVLKSHERLGIDPRRIALMGASAGGHLALLLGEELSERPGGRNVCAIIDFYGPTDLRRLRESQPLTLDSTSLLIGGSPESRPSLYDAASPLKRITPRHPPTLLVHGTDDLVVRDSQSRTYADALKKAGVAHRLLILQGTRHGFGLQVNGVDLAPTILKFLDGTCGSSANSAEEAKGEETRPKSS